MRPIQWRAHNEDRAACAAWLASFFGRDQGALVCSGSMALELALLHLGVEPGWRVVVSSNNCPQVPAAVLRCGAVPVVVDTGRDLVLTGHALRRLDEPPDAVIAVHQWGLPCPLTELRDTLGSRVPIVEDTAQGWDMHGIGTTDRDVADVVVTSMGPDKILSIDGGGAAFAHTDIGHHVDTWSPGQRTRREAPLAVALSKYALPHIPAAVAAATARTAALRRYIPDVLRRLSALGLSPWAGGGDAPPGWRFVPIRLQDRDTFERLRHAPESGALEICGPAPLDDVAFLQGRTITVPEVGARSWWVLLDPIAAWTNPGLTEQWAARARS